MLESCLRKNVFRKALWTSKILACRYQRFVCVEKILDYWTLLCVCTACGMHVRVWVMCAYVHMHTVQSGPLDFIFYCPPPYSLETRSLTELGACRLFCSATVLARELSGSWKGKNMKPWHALYVSTGCLNPGPHARRDVFLTTGPSG